MTLARAFCDQNTLARQQWLRDLQSEAQDDEQRAGQMLVGVFAWAFIVVFAIVIGLAFADWMTGEFFAAEIVAGWRART